MDEYEINAKIKVVAASATAAEGFVEGALRQESALNPALNVVSVETVDVVQLANPRERTYCVGLPVIATVRDDEFVTVEVDLSELGTSVRKDDNVTSEDVTDEQIDADADLLDHWSDIHAVMNEGYAPYLPKGS